MVERSRSTSKLLSNAGKGSTAKFSILKHRDAIVNREIRTKSAKMFHLKELVIKPPPQEIKRLAEEEWEKLQQVPSIQLKEEESLNQTLQSTKSSSCFSSQTRKDYYESIRNKDRVPPSGHYNVKFGQIERNQSVPKFIKPEYTKPRQLEPTQPVISQRPTFSMPKPKERVKKVKSTVNYDRMLRRQPMSKTITPAHDKRFILYDLAPAIYSKYKQVLLRHHPTPSFNAYMERDDRFYKTPDYQTNYNPNKEVTMINLGKVRNFKNMLKRPPIFQITETPAPYDSNYSQVIRHSPDISFDHQVPREDEHSQLPGHMNIKKLRHGLQSISKKSIEMNHYSSTDFGGNTALLALPPPLKNSQASNQLLNISYYY